MCAVIVAVFNLIGIFCLTSQPPEYNRMSENEMTNAISDNSLEVSSPEHILELKGFGLFKNLDYHLIVWPFVICAGIELLFIYNVTTFLKSYKLEANDVFLTVIGPLTGSISKMYNGFVSDWTMKKCPRVTYVILANTLQLFMICICIFAGDSVVVMTLTVLCIYNANGANFSIVPPMISEFSSFD